MSRLALRNDYRVDAGVNCLTFAAIEDLEVVAGVGREESGDVAEALGQGWGGKQRVLAFPEVVVVKVDRQGEHVDGEGVRECRLEVAGAGALVDSFLAGSAVLRTAAGFPGVLAGFSADLGLSLRPDQR